MIEAEMKNKMPEIENREDVLTSSVFGLLKYLTRKDVLVNILGRAETINGKRFLECMPDDLTTYSVEFSFWEWIDNCGEPDLIIRFKKDGTELSLCVEVKYESSKHGEEENDQLRKYFEGMCQYSTGHNSNFIGLIYLTQYPSRDEIITSINLLNEKKGYEAENKMYKLYWTEIAVTIKEVLTFDHNKLSTTDILILNDIYEYLNKKNLTNFYDYSFRSKSFDIKQDIFYSLSNFTRFRFLHEDFTKLYANKIYYGG